MVHTILGQINFSTTIIRHTESTPVSMPEGVRSAVNSAKCQSSAQMFALLLSVCLVVASQAFLAPVYRSRSMNLYHEACEKNKGPKSDDYNAMLDSLDELIARDGSDLTATGSVSSLSPPSTDSGSPGSLPLSKFAAVIVGIVFGFSYYLFENFTFGNDALANGATLLKLAEADSVSLNDAVCAKNLRNKPTVIDFYAPWCENCKTLAPTLKQLESAYKNDINFITIDGSNPKNSDLVARFHVDGIPQLSFINKRGKHCLIASLLLSSLFAIMITMMFKTNLYPTHHLRSNHLTYIATGELLTSLVGAVPKPILKEELDAFLTEKGELPYSGMTPAMFDERPETAVELEKATCELPATYQ